MELVKVVVIALLFLNNVFCRELDAENWMEGIQEIKWPNSAVIQDMLVRITRKPGPRQYLTSMGKKYAKSQTTRERHQFQTFVGLMGKRSNQHQGVP